MDKLKILRNIILIIFLLLAVKVLYPHISDIQKLYAAKNSLNYFWIVIAILSQLSQYVEDGIFTKLMFKLVNFRIKIKDTVRVASLDVFATRLFPVGQLGPLAATFYFYHKFGIDYDAIIFLNFLYSVAGISLMVLLLLISLPTIPFSTFEIPVHLYLFITVVIMVLISFTVLFLLIRVKDFHKKIFFYFSKFEWFKKVEQILGKVETYKNLFKNHKFRFIGYSFGKNLFYYLADIVTLEACFLAFHVEPHISLIIFAYIISQVAGALTLLPAGLGSTDATLGIVFLSTNINPGISVTVIILYRLISLILPFPLGILSYYSLKKEFKS